ncbi:MAG: VCBS repeat-containing protein [Planctomycetes bacterium]|nr:VCBS repeat-containing protein [Planctomycetota bacterium]
MCMELSLAGIKKTLCVVVAFGLTAASAHGQLVINPASNYAVGTRPSGVALADFDNDGDIDVATTVDDPDRIVVLLNDGTGQFVLGPTTLLPASSSPQDVVAGDLDGDGDMDLAVAVRDPQGAVLIMLNSGAGSFVNNGSVGVGVRPRGLDIADMDGDGDLDLALANRDSNTASVLTNNGVGGFTAATFATGAEPRKAEFLDFEGDGDLDLAVTNHDDRTIGLFTNNGGNFVSSGTLSVGPFVRPEGIDSADLDNDGDTDIVVGVDDQTFNINQAMVFLNTGGSFSGPFAYDTGGTRTGKITVDDFDCDGLIDLATTNRDSNDVSFLVNLGGAAFGAPMLMAASIRPGAIDTADFDGDGDPDIAVANRDSNNISIFINDTCAVEPECAEDFECDDDQFCNGAEVCMAGQCQAGQAPNCDDGDLCTNDGCDPVKGCVSTPVACPDGQSCNPGTGMCEATTCLGDLDGDGIIDAFDLALLLGNWGPCK